MRYHAGNNNVCSNCALPKQIFVHQKAAKLVGGHIRSLKPRDWDKTATHEDVKDILGDLDERKMLPILALRPHRRS
jgi:hypothetical protein